MALAIVLLLVVLGLVIGLPIILRGNDKKSSEA